MNAKLRTLKKLVEKETGVKIDSESRSRSITYPRAVFCKAAKNIKTETGKYITLQDIGRAIGKDHSTVLYNCTKLFPHAYSEQKYRQIYNSLVSAIKETEEEEQMIRYVETMESLYKKLSKANCKISELNYKIEMYKATEGKNAEVVDLMKGLNEEEVDEVLEKLRLTVRAIKSRVYL